MILVDYECFVCGHVFERMADSSKLFKVCPECDGIARRIISFNTGLRADPTWLDSACEVLQPDGERPIESRSEFDKYLKKHDIVQRC